jgi:predicted O-methyltransferase YrrM
VTYPLTGEEGAHERTCNDTIIESALQELARRTTFTYAPFDSQAFDQSYKRVAEAFVVRKSSITTRMARLLYGISAATKPKNVLVIGSALSNALIWLAIPVLATADTIIGVDLDREENDISLASLQKYGAHTVQILTMDGLDAHHLCLTIDLLFIDIYSEKRGKSEYVDIIEQMYQVLAKGAIVLAHDISYPKFREDLAPYIAIVRDKDKFQASCTLEIDRYGLEVSIR